ncbi:MAG: FHA domain-containing protein, partial [Planctomycetales bacterium]|nr:FHA domain-containing protein [Planctomycetales bacterium]
VKTYLEPTKSTRLIPIQSGERARFGRSDVADVCFPDDPEMSDVHFELECQSDCCLVRDMNGSGGTFLNDEAVAEAAIGDGDQIMAGLTQLKTTVQGEPKKKEANSADTNNDVEEPKRSAIELCRATDLEEESLQLFRPNHSPEDYVRVLTEHGQYADAIRILTLYLAKQQTIFWAYRAVHEVFPRDLVSDERGALDAAMAFLQDPTEQNRRAAMGIAETLEYANAASCVAAAAAWSTGSMAPAEFAEVPPNPDLTGQVAAAALIMTATEGDVKTIDDRYRQILKIGQEILSGESKVQRKIEPVE